VSNEQEFESRRRALLAEIEEAFDGVSREDGMTLHESIAIDDYKSEEEQRAARLLDTEKRWQDIPDDEIEGRESALSFFDAKGFRYYIPAFMTYALKHWGDDWGVTLSFCQSRLTRESQKSLRKSEPASIARKFDLNVAQCRAIARFLRFIVDFDVSMAEPANVEAVEKWEKFARERDSG
jgi:hypothetical protein